MNKKKKIIIIIISSITLILISLAVFVVTGLSSVTSKNEYVTFKIESGTSKFDITNNLVEAGIIKNDLAANIYLLVNFNLNLQAGTYKLDRSMNAADILNQIATGNTNLYSETISVVFVEGKRITDYAETISDNFDYTYDEVISVFEDKTYMKELVGKYDMLSDEVLNDKIYYALEGYLFPDTYEFYKTSSIKEIIEKMLDHTASKLSNLTDNINESKYSVHELLTMASIAEMEAIDATGRQKVAQVVYSRLAINMSLGMDVTSYYGVQKEMGSILTVDDLNADNGYNTRNANFIGLPVGPICNSSFESITAVLNPSDTNYLYFVADVTTGYIHFLETKDEFDQVVAQLRSEGKL